MWNKDLLRYRTGLSFQFSSFHLVIVWPRTWLTPGRPSFISFAPGLLATVQLCVGRSYQYHLIINYICLRSFPQWMLMSQFWPSVKANVDFSFQHQSFNDTETDLLRWFTFDLMLASRTENSFRFTVKACWFFTQLSLWWNLTSA